MTIAAASRRAPARLLKSPLAVPGSTAHRTGNASADAPSLGHVVLSDREAALAEFEDYLRTVNNREGRPYEDKTISNYVGPARNLDRWMTASGIDGDFTVIDAATLNRCFRSCAGTRPLAVRPRATRSYVRDEASSYTRVSGVFRLDDA